MEYKGCGNCAYWMPGLELGPKYQLGECTRGAPVMGAHGIAVWPETNNGQGCGEHEPETIIKEVTPCRTKTLTMTA